MRLALRTLWPVFDTASRVDYPSLRPSRFAWKLRFDGVAAVRLVGPPALLAPFEKETWVPSPMILASNPDRAVTVRERDPTS